MACQSSHSRENDKQTEDLKSLIVSYKWKQTKHRYSDLSNNETGNCIGTSQFVIVHPKISSNLGVISLPVVGVLVETATGGEDNESHFRITKDRQFVSLLQQPIPPLAKHPFLSLEVEEDGKGKAHRPELKLRAQFRPLQLSENYKPKCFAFGLIWREIGEERRVVEVSSLPLSWKMTLQL
ncbi:hypothetical protein V6N12_070173 [Hibiscus sabdariffa]|uniref:Uncharacterized protein n=1 Tax=Hibiscus sabdariffa TaxID=183260 RepID=A0ABR2FG86_9ROSI